MGKNFDLIATVDIDIQSPIVDDASFDNLLIVGPLPKSPGKTTPPAIGVYSSIDEVADAGWAVSGDAADPVGEAAAVAFAQSPRPTAVYIAPMQKSDAEEKATATITRALSTPGWYVVCTAGVDKSQYEEIAALVESTEKMFAYTETEVLGGSASVGKVYYRTLGVYGKETAEQEAESIPNANKYINVAFVAKWLSYDSGSETAAHKALASVYPSEISSTDMKKLDQANINYFVTVGSRNLTMGGKVMAGEWADIIRFRDWLKNEMQLNVVNVFATRPKVPYTDGGIALIQNQMLATLRAGQEAGGIAENEFDSDGNTIPGFVVSVPRASSLSDAEKASRKLTKCKFKARLAGAIHFAELKGSLTYSL